MKKSLLFVLLVVGGWQLCIAQNPLVKQWDYRYGGASSEFLTCFIQTNDEGFMLGGYSYSNADGDKTQNNNGYIDIWIIKIDSTGIKQWDKDFGGTGDDELTGLFQTKDNGYILAGSTSSFTNGIYDYWIIKIDSSGNKEWDNHFGGWTNDEWPNVQQTRDGGYIVGGTSNSAISGNKSLPTKGGWDYWVIRLDSLGNKQWEKDFGGLGDDRMYALDQTDDGGYIFSGYSASDTSIDKSQMSFGSWDYWVVKTDSLGNKQWDKTYGGTGADMSTFIKQTSDKGYLIGGNSDSGISGNKTQNSWSVAYDYWILKIDSLGNIEWQKDLGGNDEEELFKIIQTNDDGYLICGDSYSSISGDKSENFVGHENTWIVKLDSLRNKQWDKTILTVTTWDDETGMVIQTKDGCYVVANCTNSGIGGYKSQANRDTSLVPRLDFWIIKFCDTTQSISPHTNFISSDTTFCAESGSCIAFFDHSTNNPTSWQWHFLGAVPDTSTQQNPTNICYSTPGTYAVKLIVSNSNGSDSLTVSPMITFATSAASPVLAFSGDTIYCSHAAAYQWYLDGSPILNATDSFYVITGDGVYAVQITDGNGCTRLSDGFPVSVSSASGGLGVRLYPNPAGNQFTVYGLQFTVGSSIEVYDVLGKKVLSVPLNYKQQTINCKLLSKGIYFVRINGSAGALRLVKMD